jgi:hypothetical protein
MEIYIYVQALNKAYRNLRTTFILRLGGGVLL